MFSDQHVEAVTVHMWQAAAGARWHSVGRACPACLGSLRLPRFVNAVRAVFVFGKNTERFGIITAPVCCCNPFSTHAAVGKDRVASVMLTVVVEEGFRVTHCCSLPCCPGERYRISSISLRIADSAKQPNKISKETCLFFSSVFRTGPRREKST